MLAGQNQNSKAITLVELLVAITLLGFVILTATTIDLFARRQLIDADIRAKLLSQVSIAMDYMSQTIAQAMGDKNNTGIRYDLGNTTIRVRIDRNNITTHSNYEDDRWYAYRYRSGSAPSGQYQIWYCGNCSDSACTNCTPSWGSEIIAFKVTEFSIAFVDVNDDGIGDERDALLDINMTARYDPTLSPDPTTNPEISLRSRAHSFSTPSR